MTSKNQYGRKTWDLTQYTDTTFRSNNNDVYITDALILSQLDRPSTQLRCDLCHRKYLDSSSLIAHLDDPKHKAKIPNVKISNVTLDDVKQHMKGLSKKLNDQGWLKGMGFQGEITERLQRQSELAQLSKKV